MKTHSLACTVIASVSVVACSVATAGVSGRAAARGCGGRISYLVSVRTGAVRCDFPEIQATAAIAAPAGGWFVGVRGAVSGTHTGGLVRLDSLGRIVRSWRGTVPRTTFGVRALAVARGMVYAGGAFGVEALDALTGKTLWRVPITLASGSTYSGPAFGGVIALAADARAVFLAGDFSTVGGVRYRDCLAALDPATGRPLSWRGPLPKVPSVLPGVPKPTVLYSTDALALAGSQLLLGDSATFRYHGAAHSGVFALNERTGAITRWWPSRRVGSSGFLQAESGPGTETYFAVLGSTLFKYRLVGTGHSTLYTLTATDLKTSRRLKWHPKLLGGGRVIAASGQELLIA